MIIDPSVFGVFVRVEMLNKIKQYLRDIVPNLTIYKIFKKLNLLVKVLYYLYKTTTSYKLLSIRFLVENQQSS